MSHTYFIQDELGNVKIGKSYNPKQRLKTLQTANPSKLTLLFFIDINEEKLQNKFNKSHIRNEWFKPSQELLTFIQKHKLEFNKEIELKKQQERIEKIKREDKEREKEEREKKEQEIRFEKMRETISTLDEYEKARIFAYYFRYNKISTAIEKLMDYYHKHPYKEEMNLTIINGVLSGSIIDKRVDKFTKYGMFKPPNEEIWEELYNNYYDDLITYIENNPKTHYLEPVINILSNKPHSPMEDGLNENIYNAILKLRGEDGDVYTYRKNKDSDVFKYLITKDKQYLIETIIQLLKYFNNYLDRYSIREINRREKIEKLEYNQEVDQEKIKQLNGLITYTRAKIEKLEKTGKDEFFKDMTINDILDLLIEKRKESNK